MEDLIKCFIKENVGQIDRPINHVSFSCCDESLFLLKYFYPTQQY